jgi:hypothetical protein
VSAPQAVASGPERREEITAQIVAQTGITELMIEKLVRGFYDKVRADEVLGPIFEARIRDWEPHLQQMFAFWSSVALMTGRYHGTPMVKHMPRRSMPAISTAGSRCSRQPRANSARHRPWRTSWSARGVSPRASRWASPARTA